MDNYLANQNAQTMKGSFDSKRKPNLITTDQEKEFLKEVFQNFRNDNNIRRYSRISSIGSVFVERYIRSISLKNLFLKLVTVIGLMYYPQKRNKKIGEYTFL